MSGIIKDAWFGLRILRRSPWFTTVAVLTLGLGIAVNTTVFSWIDSVLLHPFPGAGDPKELALIETVTPAGEYLVNTSYLDYLDYRDNLRLVSGVALGRFTPVSVGADGKAARAWAELVSANYFDLLKVKPVLGRTFLPEEGRDQEEGGAPVAVISYGMWQARFGGDPKILGNIIRLNRHELTVIGVAPKEFRGSTAGVVYDVWIPVTMATAMGTGDGTLHYRGTRDETSTIVRLKSGVTIEQARAEVAALGKRLAMLYPATNRGVNLTVTPLWQGHLGAQGVLLQPLRILMALSLLLLLIVCANVANLLLARVVSRQKEFGIRLALGARRSRLARQLLTETLLLAAGGAVVGVILALWLGQLLLVLFPIPDIPLDLGGGLGLRNLAFTSLVAVAAMLLSGTVPALLTARSGLNETLKEGGRSGGTGSHRLRGLLVVCEMALVMVALIGAGLFYRSFRNASGIEPGFDRTNISVSQFYLSYAGYSAQEQHDFCRTLRERLESKPGVTGVTYSDVVPMSTASGAGSTPWGQVEVEGFAPAPGEQMMIHRATVPPGYFNLLGIRMLEGRDFTERDSAEAPRVIIVNETFAHRFLNGGNPIGRKVRYGNSQATVVAVVKDSKYHTPMEGPTPFFYIPFRQGFAPSLNFSVFIKTAGDPLRMTPVLRREASALNQDAAFSTRLLSDATAGSLFAQHAAASLLGVVGGISLLLAAIGLYSVMSYAVSQRTREMGIRMALGAQSADVLGLVLKEGLRLTVPGLLAGSVIALAAARLAGGMLVNVSASDPLTYASGAAFLGLVAALACYIPARRAMRVDPAVALRNE